jgi:cytoskeleton protein RodZ
MTEDQLESTRDLGRRLSQGRENLALSQKEIASILNLKEEIIAALDSNRFSDLPAPTYVRGYIRSYARAVSLDADNLINIYEDTADAPPEIFPDVKPKIQASSKDTPIRAMTYLIIFTLIILIISWWQGSNIVSTDLFSNNLKTSEGGEYPGGFTYSYNIVSHPEVLTMANIENAEYDSELSSEISGESVYSDILELPETTNQESHNLKSSDQLSIEVVPDLTTQTNSDILKMELTAESWIEVYDALGEKLYINLAKPGEKINLTGTPPFSIKLGNARAVSVYFKNKAIDTRKYSKAGVARFKIE